MRTRNNAGCLQPIVWIARLVMVWGLVWAAGTMALTGGDEPAAPWAALEVRCDTARQNYRAALVAIEKQYAGQTSTADPAAIMAYLAARKTPQDQYHQALTAAAGETVRLGDQIDWRPAAALLGETLLADGQYEAAAAAFDRALLAPWKAGADPEKFKTFREFLAELPAAQREYLARHQGWCCYRLGTLHERAGTPKLAVTLYHNALSLERRPRYLLALALASTLHCDYESAREWLTEASTATGQGNALIEYHLGYCLEKLWQLEPAAAAYDRAATLATAARPAVGGAEGAEARLCDALGARMEAGAPVDWNGEVPAFQATEAAARVRTAAAALTVGQRDAVGKAYRLFQQASRMNQENLAEKTAGLHPVAANFEGEKRLAEYEGLMSQAVVAFPRFVPALVKAGIIKVHREEPEQALILFQSALEADREEPAALIYFAQTALQVAGRNIEAVDAALRPPADGGAAPKPDMAALQKLWDQADRLLKPLPDIGKRLAQRLDKHAIGYEISALAEWEQVHANTYRQNRDGAADRKLLTQAHRDYLQARRRGGRTIDLFEKMHTNAPQEPAPQ